MDQDASPGCARRCALPTLANPAEEPRLRRSIATCSGAPKEGGREAGRELGRKDERERGREGEVKVCRDGSQRGCPGDRESSGSPLFHRNLPPQPRSVLLQSRGWDGVKGITPMPASAPPEKQRLSMAARESDWLTASGIGPPNLPPAVMVENFLSRIAAC